MELRGFGLVRRIYNFLRWKGFLFRNRLPIDLKRSTWSMDIQDFESIFKIIKKRRPQLILELGAGTSTVLIASKLSKFSQSSSMISFEGESKWAEVVQEMLDRYNLRRWASLYHVPYQKYSDHIWFESQRIKEILGSKKIDILIVDAPPGGLCPHSRKPAIPFFLDYLNKYSIVLLHDAKRPDERRIIQEWSKYFQEYQIVDTPCGLAIFRFPKHN